MTDPAIAARVAAFVADLDALIRTAALEAVQAALGGTPAKSSSRTPSARGGSSKRPAAKPAKTAPASSPTAKPAVVAKKKGSRRSAEDVAASARAIKAHLAANPGQGVEAIANALGVPSKDLALPIINLLGAKSIRKEGQRRGTRYFVAGSSEGKIATEAPKVAAPAPKVEAKPAKGAKGKSKKK